MSYFYKSRRNVTMVFGAFFMVMTILAFSFANAFNGSGAGIGAEGKPSGGEEAPVQSEPFPEDDEPAPVPVNHNIPSEMRGVYITPGVDFLSDGNTKESVVREEIDNAVANAAKLTMNTIIINTTYLDKVIYQTSNAPKVSGDYDIMEYIVEKARENNMYTYAIFDTSFYNKQTNLPVLAVGANEVNLLGTNLREFAEKYGLDGILVDGYINGETPESYGDYNFIGAGMGFNNFVRQSAEAVVTTASKTIRRYAPGTQIGLVADAVWENDDKAADGSSTKAEFTALGSGNADTKAFVSKGLVDFVAVKAFAATEDKAEPFEEVVKWWSGVASDSNVPMYVVHAADKAGTSEPGWSAKDQLVSQVIAAEETAAYNGSIFNNLQSMVEDKKESTTALINYFDKGTGGNAPKEEAVKQPEKTPEKQPEKAPAPAPAPTPTPTPKPTPVTPSTPPASNNNVAVKGIELDVSNIVLDINEVLDIIAEVTPSNASNKGVKWVSGNEAVATVNEFGIVKAVKPGTAKITAVSDDGGYSAVCEIEVLDPEDDSLWEPDGTKKDDEKAPSNTSQVGSGNKVVTSIDFEEREYSIDVAEKITLPLLIYPKDTTGVTISWWSSDTSIATVDGKGVVTGVSSGICNIIAEVNGTNIDIGCNIYVSDTAESIKNPSYVDAGKVDSIVFKNKSETLYVGKKTTLILMSGSKAVTNTGLEWSTSDKSIASVSSDGTVQSRGKIGTATITAQSKDGRLYAVCSVTVTNQKVNVTSITLNKSSVTLLKDKTFALTSTVAPANATVKDVKWSSSNKRIASVDSKGVVTAVGVGEATITATNDDGTVKAYCEVEVLKDAKIDSIDMYTTVLELLVGDEDQLAYEVYPAISEAEVTWRSSAPNIVSVDAKGNIKALKAGKTIITVYSSTNRGIYAVCEVTVLETY